MQRPSFADFDCSIAQTLEVVGEWWSLMVVRELFFGRRRFDEMAEDLGIARNTLTNRLLHAPSMQVGVTPMFDRAKKQKWGQPPV